MLDTYRYMNLEGSRDILTLRNTPEIHLRPQTQSPGKGWRNRPLSLSLSLVFAPLRVPFTRTTAGANTRLDPSIKIDNWRATAESRSATLGASLLGNYPEASPSLPEISPKIGAKRGKESV